MGMPLEGPTYYRTLEPSEGDAEKDPDYQSPRGAMKTPSPSE